MLLAAAVLMLVPATVGSLKIPAETGPRLFGLIEGCGLVISTGWDIVSSCANEFHAPCPPAFVRCQSRMAKVHFSERECSRVERRMPQGTTPQCNAIPDPGDCAAM